MISARRQVVRALRAGAAMLGEDLLRHSYHSPVVRLAELPADIFIRRDPLHGIAFDLSAQLARLQGFAPQIERFTPDPGFFSNIMFGSLDAELLYAMVRTLCPRRVLELGSGSTSAVLSAALRENRDAGADPARHTIVDPFPSSLLGRLPVDTTSVRRISAAELEVDVFMELIEGDILFVDTTHTVKVGSEVNYLILEILPLLAPGVYVHFHDIFLPFAYPRTYIETHLFYVEQYLLQAFLAFNPNYEVLLGAQALSRLMPEEVRRIVPSFPQFSLPAGPSSIWIRRVAADPPIAGR